MRALKRTGFILLAIGWLSCGGGIGWGVLFVGVPYPDPTPAQRAQEAFHVQVSNRFLLVGFAALVAASAVFLQWVVVAVLRRRNAK